MNSKIILFTSFFFSACQGVFIEELGDDIVYHDNAWKNIEIRSDILNKMTIFSKVERYAFDKDFIIVLQKPDYKTYISEYNSDVIDIGNMRFHAYLKDSLYYQKMKVNFPKKYLLVYESDSAIYKILKSKKYKNDNSTEDRLLRESMADSIVRNDPYHKKIFSNSINYWIIDKARMKLLGPYTKEEFYSKRKELRVSDGLEFYGGEYN